MTAGAADVELDGVGVAGVVVRAGAGVGVGVAMAGAAVGLPVTTPVAVFTVSEPPWKSTRMPPDTA